MLERLPGSSIVKWKTYAVLANAIGAVAVWRFSLLLGLSSAAALGAMWLSALGAGTLYSLFDAYTPDPLMYMLGPLMSIWLWRGQYGPRQPVRPASASWRRNSPRPRCGSSRCSRVLDGRRDAAVRLVGVSMLVTLAWLATHASFMAVLDLRVPARPRQPTCCTAAFSPPGCAASGSAAR